MTFLCMYIMCVELIMEYMLAYILRIQWYTVYEYDAMQS